MTSVLYFLHLKTLDILLLIVNISVAEILHENVNFQQFFVVVKMTETRKNQSEEWTYFILLFIYFITVNKYWFCISVIRYINVQIIGIAYKKNQYRSITNTEFLLSLVFENRFLPTFFIQHITFLIITH